MVWLNSALEGGRMKILLGIGIGIISVILVLVLVAGYFGLVPGVSNIFGSNKPVDLGVSYTQADYQSARAKGNIQRVDLPADTPPEQSLSFSGEQDASFNLTQEEVTALIDEKVWVYFPMHDCQVRFNPDGSAEFSGILELDTLKDYARARGVSEGDMDVVLERVGSMGFLQKNMPFYIKGTGSVVNGSISFNTTAFKIGRISILSQFEEYKSQLVDLLHEDVLSIPGFSVNNFSISNGQMHFDGTLPTSVTRSKG
jgi:hypothetical protein